MVRRGGRVIALQQPADPALAEKYGVSPVFFVVTTRRDRLDDLAGLIADGHVEVAIAETYPLANGRAAYESGGQRRPAPGRPCCWSATEASSPRVALC
jgi:hypothetical protein